MATDTVVLQTHQFLHSYLKRLYAKKQGLWTRTRIDIAVGFVSMAEAVAGILKIIDFCSLLISVDMFRDSGFISNIS